MRGVQPDEKVLFTGRTHAKILVKMFFVQFVLLALHVAIVQFWPTLGFEPVDRWVPVILHSVILLLEIAYVVAPLLQWWNSTFTLTDRRVLMRWGVFTKREQEVRLAHITSVNTERSLVDRIFGAGTIVMKDAGSERPVRMTDIPRAVQVKDKIDALRDNRGPEPRTY